MSLIQSSSSPQADAARRANSLESTGPRSPAGKRQMSLNALKHGAHARRLAESLRALGESPREYRQLLRDLVVSHAPATPAETLLVGDLAALRWQRRRTERAQASQLAWHRQEFARLQAREGVERRRSWWARQQTEHPGGGLRYAPESESKFEELTDRLFDLQERLVRGDFSDQTRDSLRYVYGEHPTARGLHIVELYDGATRPGTPERFRQAARRALVVALGEEARDLTLEEDAYLREVAEPPNSARHAWLAPDNEAWRHLLRQQAALDRQIERKTRLLLQMQHERRSGPRDEPEEAASQKDCFLAKQSCEVIENKGGC